MDTESRGEDSLEASTRGRVVALGNFDGVHLGHQRILEHMTRQAHLLGASSLVVSFTPNPKLFLGRIPGTLMDDHLRRSFLRGYADEVIFIPFLDVAHLDGLRFIREWLLNRWQMKAMVVGEQFRFGHGRSGDVRQLEMLAHEAGFGLHVIPPLVLEGSRISSTRIREAVQAGAVATAASLLGRPPLLRGQVTPGRQLGRILGFPTLNMETSRLILPHGVFTTAFRFEDEGPWLKAVSNIGCAPTVGGGHTVVETHILDNNYHPGEDLGRWGRVALLERIREERCFGSVEALQDQIQVDIASVLRQRSAWWREQLHAL